jgi:hypothetical protein
VFAGQISQTGNMTSIHGMSRVLVTGDTSVGLSTLITEVTVSQFTVFVSSYFVWCIWALRANNKVICTALQILSPAPLGVRFCFFTSLARTETSHQIPTDPSLGWLPDLYPLRTDVPSFMLWPKGWSMFFVVVGIRVTKAATNLS